MLFSIVVLVGLALCFAVAFICSLYRHYWPRRKPMEVPPELVSTLGIVKVENGWGNTRIFKSAKYSGVDYEFDEKHPHPCFELEN